MIRLLWVINQGGRYSKCLCLLSVLFFCGYPIAAAEPEAATEADPWQWLERGRSQISRNVTALGRNLDTWLSGERIGDSSNETYLRVRLDQQVASFDGYHSRFKIDGSLDLPRTSKRWKLIFESDATGLNSLEDSVLGNEGSGQSMGGIQYQQSSSDSWQLSHSVGLRSRLPTDPYYRFKAQYEHRLSDEWSVGYRQRIWHYRSQGWGYNSNVSFDRKMDQGKILRVSSEVRYQQGRRLTEFSQTIALHDAIREYETMSYEAGVLGVNSPNVRVNSYFVGTQYRRAIRDDWLFFELVPRLVVSRDENWRPQPMLMLNLEMLFFDI